MPQTTSSSVGNPPRIYNGSSFVFKSMILVKFMACSFLGTGLPVKHGHIFRSQEIGVFVDKGWYYITVKCIMMMPSDGLKYEFLKKTS